jgi:hypothetical protein
MVGVLPNRQMEDAMGTHGTSLQHPEIGSVAMRMLWIPAVASILVVGHLALRAPQDGAAATMAPAASHAAPSVVQAAQRADATPRSRDAVPAAPDEATTTHEALDPVGAGHDVAR